MVEAFIRKHGVTKCPGFGTPEFRELNIAREKERAEATGWWVGHSWRRRARPRKATV